MTKEEMQNSLVQMVEQYSLSRVMSELASAANSIECDIEERACSELGEALHTAICDVGLLSKSRRPRDYMKWLRDHSSHIYLNTYEKFFGLENAGKAARDFAKCMEEQADE